MNLYAAEQPVLLAVDCIVFGFDGHDIKILLIKRGFEPEKNKWSLMGGFLLPDETTDEAANRILNVLTGITGIYLEQLHVFSALKRDPEARTISIAYYALIDINKYEKPENGNYKAEWFLLSKKPRLIFDHDEMVRMALTHLRNKAAQQPVLFELLPKQFTIPQLQKLYEGVYDTYFDNRNFTRKLMSTGLLMKQKVKDKSASKKGAFYYKVDKRKYRVKQEAFLQLVPKANRHHN